MKSYTFVLCAPLGITVNADEHKIAHQKAVERLDNLFSEVANNSADVEYQGDLFSIDDKI